MPEAVTSPRTVRIQGAAKILGVSPSTVRRWSAAGRLACERTPSGQRRFRIDDLERLLAAGCGDGGPQPADPDAEQRYRLLFDTSLELASRQGLAEVLRSAARRLSAALAIRDCDIYRLEPGERLVCLASVVDGIEDVSWAGRELRLADWPCDALAVRSRRPVSVASLKDPRLSERERADLRRYGQRSFIALPLLVRDQVIGLVDLLDPVERRFSTQEIATAEGVGQLVALALERAELYEEVKHLHLGNLRALSSALGAKDAYTLGHAGRVAGYMVLLGSELGWPPERLEQVQDMAFLHDVGKIGISERILLKPGPLTSEQWELVRQHPVVSAEIVRPLFDEESVAGVRHHHERFDGGGYPDGLAGSDIPLLARALCVVDCYDAMSCRRPYRQALSYRACLTELRRCAGSQFDPQLVAAFAAALSRLARRRRRLTGLAEQAAGTIDPAAHALLRSRSDEARPAYHEMVAALRGLRDAHPSVRFITSFAQSGAQCITVLDTGESEHEISHVGDPYLPGDQLAALLAGRSVSANVLLADEFGVWVCGLAPVLDASGSVVAALSVDAPAVASLCRTIAEDRAHTLAGRIQSAALRMSRAEVEAITDGLTGLYNHRYLHERLDEELQRAAHRGGTLAVLFGDCDHFKAFNDAHGHKAGDGALMGVARIVESAGRRVDLAARYGGEEFVLVLIGADSAGALEVAERIRAQVERDSAAEGYELTISIGVASYPEDAAAKDELLDKADWAMYAAKRAGRNRVLAFSEGLVSEECWLSRRR